MRADGHVLTFIMDRVPTPIGDMLVVVDRDGNLRGADFFDHEERMRTLLRQQYAREGTGAIVEGLAPKAIRAAIDAYFEGDIAAIDKLPVKTGGTPFQREVWRLLRLIPAGKTTTYGKLAARLGVPNAARAVGMANGANPIGVIVPCHRVIGSDASLTGYGGGLPRKQWLLTHEGAAFRSPGTCAEPMRLPGI
jgi:methylated-DNA-[protein]-cysteine S-methyltransferase